MTERSIATAANRRASPWTSARAIAVCIALLPLLAAATFAQDLAALEIAAPPGTALSLDGATPVDVGDGHVLFDGLSPGTHTLRAGNDGFFPLVMALDLRAGQVRAIVLTTERVQMTASTSEDRASAALRATASTVTLQCFPMACSMTVARDGGAPMPTENADTPQWSKAFGEDTLVLRGLPQGSYRFEFAATVDGQPRTTGPVNETVCNGDTLAFFVDFLATPIVARSSGASGAPCPALAPDAVGP